MALLNGCCKEKELEFDEPTYREKMLEQKCFTELYGNRLYHDPFSKTCQKFIEYQTKKKKKGS